MSEKLAEGERSKHAINNASWKNCGHPVYLRTNHCELCEGDRQKFDDSELLSVLRTFIYHGRKVSDRWIRNRSLYNALQGVLVKMCAGGKHEV